MCVCNGASNDANDAPAHITRAIVRVATEAVRTGQILLVVLSKPTSWNAFQNVATSSRF